MQLSQVYLQEMKWILLSNRISLSLFSLGKFSPFPYTGLQNYSANEERLVLTTY